MWGLKFTQRRSNYIFENECLETNWGFFFARKKGRIWNANSVSNVGIVGSSLFSSSLRTLSIKMQMNHVQLSEWKKEAYKAQYYLSINQINLLPFEIPFCSLHLQDNTLHEMKPEKRKSRNSSLKWHTSCEIKSVNRV